jgi:hypothetical protein
MKQSGSTSAPPPKTKVYKNSNPNYKPLHPEIFEYNPKFIDPALLKETEGGKAKDARKFVTEKVEQIYYFQLFTPEFCQLLIEEAEHCGKWHTELEDTAVTHPVEDSIIEEDAPSTEVKFDQMPGLQAVYDKIIDLHIKPIVEDLWKTFTIQKRDMPFVLKYSMDVIKEMKLHYDCETVSMVIYLNRDFEGGGTFFPKWNFVAGAVPGDFSIGSMVVYPGGVSHEHMGLPITSGVRYLMLGCFY